MAITPVSTPTSPLRTLFAYLVTPGLVGGGIALVLAMLAYGFDPMPTYMMVNLIFFLAVFFLEKALPLRQEWTVSDGQEMHDFGHSMLGTALGAGTGEAICHLIFAGIGLWAAGSIGHGLWPTHLPFWVQLVMAYLIADLGRYVQHRLLHRYEFLWRFHALHHSIDKLGALKSSRSHVVERLLQPFFLFSVLFTLGVPADVYFWYLMPNSFLAIMDHSNLDARIGPLGYIFVGPAQHRLHHSVDMREGNSNFGSSLVIWDMIFGTYADPGKAHAPERVGIENDPMPSGFLAQVFEPFKARKTEADDASAAVPAAAERLETA